ncbi:hypothetical protein AAVH_15185 [Aphelenchoides avenae]|nr:hypothetical protein AAVH_15185 [Aphelenchus avenae]
MSCYRIIWTLSLEGTVSLTSFFGYNAVYLMDSARLERMERAFASVTIVAGYVRTPLEFLLALNRCITLARLRQFGPRMRRLFDILILVSWLTGSVLLALFHTNCDVRIVDHQWDWRECKLIPVLAWTEGTFIYPQLVVIFACYLAIFGLLLKRRHEQKFRSFHASFEWSILAITCADFALALAVLFISRYCQTTFGGSGIMQLAVSVLMIHVNATGPVFLLAFNRTFRRRAMDLLRLSGNETTQVQCFQVAGAPSPTKTS